MNINNIGSTYYQYPSTSHTYPQKRSGMDFQKSEEKVTSQWKSMDTCELSSPQQTKGDMLVGSTPDPESLQHRKSMINYTADDLTELKDRFAELTNQRDGITAKLQKLTKSLGIHVGFTDRLKVEIGSNGKAIVGGISDAKKAKELENAINKDGAFLKEIQSFQKEEADISTELRSLTGKSLKDFTKRISELQKGGGMNVVHSDGLNHVYSREDCIALRDQDLYVVDNEFGTMINKYITGQDVREADFTGSNNILEDADSAVNRRVKDVLNDVGKYFSRHNEYMRKLYTDPEELEKHLASLKNLAVRVDSSGNVEIEGQACKDANTDLDVKKGAKEIFNQALQTNPYTSEKDDFFIAAQHLENKYDLAFDGKDKDRKLVTTFQDGKIESRLSSPEEEENLDANIAIEAKAALTDMGIDGESYDIGVDEKGKIVVHNMPQGDMESKILKNALQVLNDKVEKRTNSDYTGLSTSFDPVDKLKGLLAKKDVFLPGGISLLKNMQPAEEI